MASLFSMIALGAQTHEYYIGYNSPSSGTKVKMGCCERFIRTFLFLLPGVASAANRCRELSLLNLKRELEADPKTVSEGIRKELIDLKANTLSSQDPLQALIIQCRYLALDNPPPVPLPLPLPIPPQSDAKEQALIADLRKDLETVRKEEGSLKEQLAKAQEHKQKAEADLKGQLENVKKEEASLKEQLAKAQENKQKAEEAEQKLEAARRADQEQKQKIEEAQDKLKAVQGDLEQVQGKLDLALHEKAAAISEGERVSKKLAAIEADILGSLKIQPAAEGPSPGMRTLLAASSRKAAAVVNATGARKPEGQSIFEIAQLRFQLEAQKKKLEDQQKLIEEQAAKLKELSTPKFVSFARSTSFAASPFVVPASPADPNSSSLSPISPSAPLISFGRPHPLPPRPPLASAAAVAVATSPSATAASAPVPAQAPLSPPLPPPPPSLPPLPPPLPTLLTPSATQ